ncbi:NACHT domain-containing protein [Micromonospora sp. NPDC049559]|uniref:NACHT domain-containing protein n=1 Tax=Micromonospora sp. NPDC049559 TaxID=3155923 RepID=UPI00343CD7DC
MPRRSLRRLLAMAVLAVAAALSALIWVRYDFEKVSWAWGVVGGAFGAFVVVYQVVRDRDAGRGAPAARMRAVAEELADLVRRNPVDEALLRSLEEPYPLPVTWVNAAEEYQPSWRTICRSSDGVPLDLAGRDDEVADRYLRIPSGRMLVLGPAGSGKSVLALRLAQRLVTGRAPEDPIPVLLNVAAWDPDTVPFDHWVVSQLANRYPQLSTAHPRWAQALRDLLDANLVLPVLDGLDEAGEERAAHCLDRLNRLPGQRLVLTCRTGFYQRYLRRGEKLRGAAVVTIEPLRPRRVADYLADAAPARQLHRWRPVTRAVAGDEQPELTAALSTPLMVAMARTAFDAGEIGSLAGDRDDDPAVLIELARRGGRQEVEDRLLDGAVESAVRLSQGSWRSTRWPPAAARGYLAFLAGQLETYGLREFVWWRLPMVVPGALWVLFDGLRASLAAWVALALTGDALRSVAATTGTPTARELLVAVGTHAGALTVGVGLAGAAWSVRRGRASRQGVPPVRMVFRGGPGAFAPALLPGLFAGLLWGAVLYAGGYLYEPVWPVVEFLEPYAVPVGSWSPQARVAVTLGLVCLVYTLVREVLRVDFAAPADQLAVTDPLRVLAADRAATVLSALPAAARWLLRAAIVAGVLRVSEALGPVRLPPSQVVAAGLGLGLGAWLLGSAGSAWVRFGLARFALALTGMLPHRLLEFLASVEAVGLLRNLGGSYRFRHERLRDRLALPGGWPRAARWEEEFATGLARAGYWDEASSFFGRLLADRAGVAGSDELLAAGLRKGVFAGAAAGRWWRTEQRLLAVLASYPAPERPRDPAVAARRAEISELVRQDAPPERLLAACDALIAAETRAGGAEPSSLEFRAVLRYVGGDLAGARAQFEELLGRTNRTDGADRTDRDDHVDRPAHEDRADRVDPAAHADRDDGAEREHSVPVAAALLTRAALLAGRPARALAIGRHELTRTGVSPRTADLARLAETWWWSVRVLAGVADEVAVERRRLLDAVRAARASGRRRAWPTAREGAELGLLLCARWIGDPWLGRPVLRLAHRLIGVVDNARTFPLTVDRTAPLWSDGRLPPPPERPAGADAAAGASPVSA